MDDFNDLIGTNLEDNGISLDSERIVGKAYWNGYADGTIAERKRIMKVFEPFEWSGSHTDYEDSWAVMTRACPFCFNAKKDGHKPDCAFVKFMDKELK